jgi:RNA polymerase sigma-70 factor (ECF subfamily)
MSEVAVLDEDARLMCRLRDGDEAAFDRLFERWRLPIVRFAVRFVGRQDRGEELAQEVFLKLYRARARYEPRERFAAWIFRVATNTCLNEVRRPEYRHRATAVEELYPEPTDKQRPRADEVVHAARLQAAVREAVAELPDTQRAALLLQQDQGLSYEEIAETLDSTVPAVKALLNRARRTLTERLGPWLKEARPAQGVGA